MTVTRPGKPETVGPWGFLRTVRQSLLAREVGSLWMAEVVVLATAITQAAVVARALGPERFGTAALVLGTTALVFTFLDPQSQEAVVKYLGGHHAVGRVRHALAVPKVAYGADLLIGVAGLAVVAASSSWLADNVIHSHAADHLLLIYAAASTLAAPSTTSRSILTTFRRFSTVAVLQAGSAVFRTALVIVLVVAGAGVAGVVYGTAISVVVESVCAGVLAHRTVRRELGASWWSGRRATLGEQFREMVRFMVYTDLTTLVTAFVKQADLVALGLVRGPAEAGYYRLARSMTAPLASIVTPLQQVVYPRFAALAGTGDATAMGKAARRYTVNVGLPVAALALLGLPLLPFVVPAVAGSEYRPAVGVAAVLVAGGALSLPAFWSRPMLLAGGHVRFLLSVSIVLGGLTVVGYVVFAHLMGDVGVAISRAGIAGVGGSAAAVIYLARARKKDTK